MESHYKLTSEMAMHVISTSTQDGTRCLHHSWSELELINSCNYCRVIWHSNDHLMYPSLVKTEARWVLFWFGLFFAPVSKGLNMWWPETDQQHSSSIHKSISWPTALVASKTLWLKMCPACLWEEVSTWACRGTVCCSARRIPKN